MQERDNLLRILKEAKESIRADNSTRLKDLSDQSIHTASIHQDPDIISVAVIIYAMSKIIERTRYREYQTWPRFYKDFMICFDRAISALEDNQMDYFRQQLKCVRRDIEGLTGNFKKHVENVFKKAEINKASRIYEHGISMEQTAKLLGISIWELAEYSGETGISDVNLNATLEEKARIKIATEILS